MHLAHGWLQSLPGSDAVVYLSTLYGMPSQLLRHGRVAYFDASKTLEGTSGVCCSSNVCACGQLYAGGNMAGISCNQCKLLPALLVFRPPERRTEYGRALGHCETGVIDQSYELFSCTP